MGRRNHVESGSPSGPFLLVAPGQLPRRVPRRIGFDRATTSDEPLQHRVVHPGAGEKPCPYHPTLAGIRAQRPRPHMCRCALRPLTRPRLALARLPRLSGRSRCHAASATHTATVEMTTDKPDLSARPTQRVAADLGDLGSGAAAQGRHRLRAAPRVDRRRRLRPHARTPVIAVEFRRLLQRRTAVDHQAIHRRPEPATMSAGLRPATERMGVTPG